MRMSIKSPADFASGIMFSVIGIGALVLAADYPVGSLRRMGPGMLPIILCFLLTASGIALTIQSLLASSDDAESVSLPGLGTFRAAFFVLLSLLVFALLMRPAGMFLATVALVFISTRAEPNYSLFGAVVLSIFMAGLAVGIFVYGLGLPFRVWP